MSESLGALRPDHVVVGLTDGFHVTSGDKVLEPGGQQLTGRTLYLPLPYLPFLRPDEFVAVIGHELAHFSGDDTAYSLRFLPIYAGVGRSLEAIAQGGVDGRGAGSPLLGPALRLGLFVMDQFHHAVRHWSRQREFAADATGAGLSSPEAAARALLRVSALHGPIDEALAAATENPEATSNDLVADVFRHALTRGLDDPSAHLEDEQAHPTDTHPPTRQRLAALGHPPTPDRLADAATVPPREALSGLGAFFADPAALCRAATVDFLDDVRRNAAAYRSHLEAVVAEVDPEERVLSENFRSAGVFLVAFGGIFALVAAGLAVLAPNTLGTGSDWVVVAAALVGGLGLIAYGIVLLRRGVRPFLVLRPETLAVPGLDRAIAWTDIADFDINQTNRRVTTRLLLPPEAPFPQRVPGRRVKLDPKQRIVTLSATLPKGMTLQAYADLLVRYRHAADARLELAQSHIEPIAPGDGEGPESVGRKAAA